MGKFIQGIIGDIMYDLSLGKLLYVINNSIITLQMMLLFIISYSVSSSMLVSPSNRLNLHSQDSVMIALYSTCVLLIATKVSAPNSGQFLLSVLYLRHASKLLDP